jgi:hypothetical protein
MAVPKTPMNEDDLSTGGKDDIRLARKTWCFEPESIAHPVQQRADLPLWRGVTSTDQRHPRASLAGGECIHQLPPRHLPLRLALHP